MLLSNCGTSTRLFDPKPGIYPATKRDCLWTRQLCVELLNSPPALQDAWLLPLPPILLVVDFPLSVVTDTLLLPRDVMKKEYPLEHPGADQQATKHADKVPAKVKPPPSTSKDAPQ